MKRLAGIIGTGILVAMLSLGLSYQWGQITNKTAKASPIATIVKAVPRSAVQTPVQKESAKIQNILDNVNRQYPGQISAVVINLRSGAQGRINAGSQLVSASLYKMYVAWGVYQKIDANTLTIDDMTGSLGEDVGTCLQAMIEVSDNDCGVNLGFMVGWQNLDQNLKSIGLANTLTNNYDSYGNLTSDKITTANDVAVFLKQLYEGKILSQASTNDFISLLKNDQINNWLPSGLPADTVVAHKTADLYDSIHDAGIIYTPINNYLEVLMTHGWNDPFDQAPPVFSDLSKQLWNLFVS